MSRHSLRQLPQDEPESLDTSVELSEPSDSAAPHRFERGQTLVEYALIIALVAIVVIAALYLLAPTIADTFNRISNAL